MSENRWAIGARRTGEAAAAAALIGAAYHCLDERDGMIVYDKPSLQKCYDLFRRLAPQLVFSHSPLDYMMDHVMVSQLARAASFIYGAPNISAVPLREGSCVPHLYYCDTLEGIDPLGKPVQPTTWVDIGDTIGKEGGDARLPHKPARVAAVASRNRRIHRLDAPSRGNARLRGGRRGGRGFRAAPRPCLPEK